MTVFIFCVGIDDVLLGSSKVAGIQVQMSFWARTFVKYGNSVFSFSANKRAETIEGIVFIKAMRSRLFETIHLNAFQELLDSIKCIQKKPDLIIIRGASRSLFFITKLSRLIKSQLIFFGASDTDFIPGKEIVGGHSLNRRLYQMALRDLDKLVTQNSAQQEFLLRNYQKNSLVLPNIWIQREEFKNGFKYDAIWIANLRPLKRAEWFVELAKNLPQFRFALVGGALVKSYNDLIEKEASVVDNLYMLGPQSFQEVNELLSNSRVLVCTSEFEGFPNTFLQAWAQAIPVVSTVNPSNLLDKNHLGYYVTDQKDLILKTLLLLSDDCIYNRFSSSIKQYFVTNHSADNAYSKLLSYYSL